MITKEMVVTWKSDPVTKAVIQAVNEEREIAKDYFASGATLIEHAATAQVVGRCQAYDHLVSIIEDLKEESVEESDND